MAATKKPRGKKAAPPDPNAPPPVWAASVEDDPESDCSNCAQPKSGHIEGTLACPPPPPRTEAQFNLALRRKVRLFYDIQEMRLSAGGRLLKKSPINPITLHPDDLKRLKGRVSELEGAEKGALEDVADHLNEVPFYVNVIKADRVRWRGIGPTMAGVILSSFDIVREDTPSKMWAFAGLAPVPATRCKLCSNVVEGDDGAKEFKHPKPQGCKCKYAGGMMPASDTFGSGKSMRPVAGEKIKYNKWLRAKLCGVLGAVLLKLSSPYRFFYDNYKTRKTSAGWGKSDAHRHAASIRYMIKMMLLDLWREWRTYLNLPVRPSYQEQYLGHTHGEGAITWDKDSGKFIDTRRGQPGPGIADGAAGPDDDDEELNEAMVDAAVAEAD